MIVHIIKKSVFIGFYIIAFIIFLASHRLKRIVLAFLEMSSISLINYLKT